MVATSAEVHWPPLSRAPCLPDAANEGIDPGAWQRARWRWWRRVCDEAVAVGMISAFNRRVAGERMQDEAVRGDPIDLDRERAVGPAVAETWRHDTAFRHAAAHQIERHREASMAGKRRSQSSASSSVMMVRFPIFRPRRRPHLSSEYAVVRPGP